MRRSKKHPLDFGIMVQFHNYKSNFETRVIHQEVVDDSLLS